MSSAIDLRKCPVPAIVPPVPESLTSDSGQRGDNGGLTGTSDETSDFAVRLPPNLRARAIKMRIKVTAILGKGSRHIHILFDGKGELDRPRTDPQKNREGGNVTPLLRRKTRVRCHCRSIRRN
jgi:hypothetical protein